MFSYLKGILEEKNQTYAVLDVNGIGFKIYTSLTTLSDEKMKVGSSVTFYTYMYIKEGIMDLYGFSSKEELELFENLISVNGVGAKGAACVLSLAETKKIASCIISDDSSFIKKASGIGTKTAQRICLELKDKIKNEAVLPSGNADAGTISSDYKDAIDALVSLGYSLSEAQRAVGTVPKGEGNAENIIKLALKNLL